MLLVQFKKYCEEKDLDCDFTDYKALCSSPWQVHHSMEEHKQAIFVLALALLAAAKQKPEAAMQGAVRSVIHTSIV